MSVKRYSLWCRATHGHDLSERVGGEYVPATDYDAAEARIAELEALAKDAPLAHHEDRTGTGGPCEVCEWQARLDAALAKESP